MNAGLGRPYSAAWGTRAADCRAATGLGRGLRHAYAVRCSWFPPKVPSVDASGARRPPGDGRPTPGFENENCPNNGKKWLRAGGRGRDDAWKPPVPNSDERASACPNATHGRDGAEQHVANSDGVVLGMDSRGLRLSTPNVALSGGRRPSA